MIRLAVFDVDSTLSRLPALELRFMAYLLQTRVLSARCLARWTAQAVGHGVRNGGALRNFPRFWMRGLKIDRVKDLAEAFLIGIMIGC